MSAPRVQPTMASLFLAERYVAGANREVARADAARAKAASEELAAQGGTVRYLGSTLVPADETCFAMFEADSAGAVRRLLDHAALPYEHIVEAVRIGEEEP